MMHLLRINTSRLSGFGACRRHRFLSSAVTARTATDTGICTLSMDRKPANLLNTEFLVELRDEVEQVGRDSQHSSLVLASEVANIFSGGLDIMELYQPKEDRLRSFWSALQDAWLAFYTFPKPMAAAIAGAAPAGGCMLALCADWRVIHQKYGSIGLNETKLALMVPQHIFAAPFTAVVGQRRAEHLLQTGAVLPAGEALKAGLVDQVVDTDGDTHEAANQATIAAAHDQLAKHWLTVSAPARGATKAQLRQPVVSAMIKDRQSDLDQITKFLASPAVQKGLGAYVAALKKKKQ